MQCVILAAGKGTRLMPLTAEIPKPLVQVGGVPLINRIVDSLPASVDEIVMVIGHRGDQMREHCGEMFGGRRITYVVQDVPKGTGHALHMARNHLTDRFLYLFADDLHGADDLVRLVATNHAILAMRHDKPERFGVVLTNADGTLQGIIEKPTVPPSNLVSTGPMVLPLSVFDYEVGLHSSGELVLTDAITQLAQDVPMQVVEQKLWIPIGYPEDIARAEHILSESI